MLAVSNISSEPSDFNQLLTDLISVLYTLIEEQRVLKTVLEMRYTDRTALAHTICTTKIEVQLEIIEAINNE